MCNKIRVHNFIEMLIDPSQFQLHVNIKSKIYMYVVQKYT
jgi:hypothetical protein